MNKTSILKNSCILIGISCLFAFTPISTNGKYTNKIEPQADILIGKEICILSVLQGINIENRTYLNWSVKTDAVDYCFMLLKSDSNSNFKPVAIVKGHPSIRNSNVMYCFTDSTSNGRAVCFYKLLAFNGDSYNESKGVVSIREDIQEQIIRVEHNKPGGHYSLPEYQAPALNQPVYKASR